MLGALLNFAIIFGLFTMFLVVTDNFPGAVFAAIVPVLALQVLFAIGLGMIVGVLNVFFRDIGQLFGIVLPFWFWLTPIVYPVSILPEGMSALPALNPMAAIIGAWQRILVAGEAPLWGTLAAPLAIALVLCLLGMRLFRKRAGEMVDEL